jgi:hypothetical protein
LGYGGKKRKNMEMGVIRRPAVVGGGAEVPWWCGGGDRSDGWQWDLDFREFGGRENTEEVGELYGMGEKMGKKGKNSDLKGSSEEPKTHAIERTKCVRSHSC